MTDPRIADLRDYLVGQRDFNRNWLLLHEAGSPALASPSGRLKMAARRREIVAELQGWIEALDTLSGVEQERDAVRESMCDAIRAGA